MMSFECVEVCSYLLVKCLSIARGCLSISPIPYSPIPCWPILCLTIPCLSIPCSPIQCLSIPCSAHYSPIQSSLIPILPIIIIICSSAKSVHRLYIFRLNFASHFKFVICLLTYM